MLNPQGKAAPLPGGPDDGGWRGGVAKQVWARRGDKGIRQLDNIVTMPRNVIKHRLANPLRLHGNPPYSAMSVSFFRGLRFLVADSGMVGRTRRLISIQSMTLSRCGGGLPCQSFSVSPAARMSATASTAL